MKHTKGKWIVEDGRKIVTLNNRKCIADTWDFDVSKTEEEANAKLIAAAPELLDAVLSTQKFFDDMPKGQFGKLVFDAGLMNDMFFNISKSLKKATE